MNRLNLFPIFIFLILLSICTTPTLSNETFTDFHQTEIIEMLEEPDSVNVLTKTTEYVWGPQEQLWYELEMVEKLVTWI